MTEEFYKTKRTITVTSSADDYVLVGQYDVYMNRASTLGIFDAKGTFVPLMVLQCLAIDWEYPNGSEHWKKI